MGYFLLYESMLDTVLYARNRWLAPGGAGRRTGRGKLTGTSLSLTIQSQMVSPRSIRTVYPQYCTMYIAGIEDTYFAEQRLGYWNNVYGRGP